MKRTKSASVESASVAAEKGMRSICFGRGIVQRLLVGILVPHSTVRLSFVTVTVVLVKVAMHPSSQSCAIDKRDVFSKLSLNTCANIAQERLGKCNRQVPTDLIVWPLGRSTCNFGSP